jgi:hypothetical protein
MIGVNSVLVKFTCVEGIFVRYIVNIVFSRCCHIILSIKELDKRQQFFVRSLNFETNSFINDSTTKEFQSITFFFASYDDSSEKNIKYPETYGVPAAAGPTNEVIL